MKVLLVYPGITGSGFGSYGEGMEESWISHGLCLLSASAKAGGHRVSLLDLRRLSGWKECAERLAADSPEVVGITMMSVDYNPAMRVAELVRRHVPTARIMIGGPHPSICADEFASDRRVDHVVVGEGEVTFPKLLEKIGRKEEIPRILRGEVPDLDCIPFADRDLFGGPEHPLEGMPFPFLTVIAGRGCIYNCSFCQPAERMIFGKSVRRRSVPNVMEELRQLAARQAFRSFMIHDDCLTEDREWCLEFAGRYREEGFARPFACQSRADLVCRNEDVITALSEAGMRLMFVGFESGNQRVLNILRKGTRVEQNFEAARILRRCGVSIWANYMFGVPTETNDEVMDTVRMIREISPDHYSPAYFTPHPGSDLFRHCVEQGLSLIESHDSYRRNPTEAKIRGVDYVFLKKAVYLSMGQDFRASLPARVTRFIAGLRPYLQNRPTLRRLAKAVIRHMS